MGEQARAPISRAQAAAFRPSRALQVTTLSVTRRCLPALSTHPSSHSPPPFFRIRRSQTHSRAGSIAHFPRSRAAVRTPFLGLRRYP